MLSNEENDYYARQILLDEIGEVGQDKLAGAKVLVVGAGGLGCPVLQYLVSAGVGRIGIVDEDVVEITNLHRQILYSIDHLGANKSFIAAKQLRKLNPFVEIQSYPTYINSENALSIVSAYDIVVDCTDNYTARFVLNDACAFLCKALVSGSIYRFEGQVTVFSYKNGPTLRCMFPVLPSNESTMPCSESGVIGVVPGIIGLLQANEVIKIILEKGHILSGELLVFNAKANSFDTFELLKNEAINYTDFVKNGQLIPSNYQQFCNASVENQLSLEKFISDNQLSKYKIIDVRNRDEFPPLNVNEVETIPLNMLRDAEIDVLENSKILVVCKTGVRSTQALEILKDKGIKNEIYSLIGGVSEEFIAELKKLEYAKKLF